MTTTAVFSVSRDDVINAALRHCGALAQGQTAAAQDLTDCALALNVMLKAWDAEGYKAWLYRTLTWSAVANKASYSIGEVGADVPTNRPLRIPLAYTKDSNNNKTPLVMRTRQEFEMLTPSNAQGPSNSYHYDPQLGLGVFWVWPIPTDTTRSFNALLQRPIYDISSSVGTDTFDVPQEWYRALTWGLAEEVMVDYGTPENIMRRIDARAPLYLATASGFSEEDGSVYFQIDPQGGFGRAR